jgi:hypothetical protein
MKGVQPRADLLRDRRVDILDAAGRVFADAPYEAVNILTFGAVGTRALVNHCRSKRELIETLRAVTAAPDVVRTDLDLPVEEMVARNTDAWLDHEANVSHVAGHRRGGRSTTP